MKMKQPVFLMQPTIYLCYTIPLIQGEYDFQPRIQQAFIKFEDYEMKFED
jgi:hypothetical protein